MKKYIRFLLFVFVCSIPLFLTFNKGINYFDEGYILEGARRILMGDAPYRDFHFVYTPGIIYYLAVFFRLLGQSIIIERVAAALVSIVGVIFLGLLIQKQTKNNILSFLSMFLYVLWGPGHLNFLWPVMCVLPLMFIYLYLFAESHFFLAGVVIAITILCKHNFGVALIISLICYLLYIRQTKRQILTVGIGFMSVMVFFVIHLLSTQSLLPFFADMNTYTIQEILIRKSFSVAFPTQSIGKFVLYTFPGVAPLIIGAGIIIKKKDISLLLIPFTLLFMYLFGIFPTPDWTHLLPLLSFTGVLFALVPRIFGDRYRFLTYFFMVLFICVGIYSISVRNYYRWEAPLIKQTHCFSSGVMKYICVDEKNYSIITQTVPLIKKETAKDQFIFAFYNNPLYYFLAQRNNPTPFIDFNVMVGKKEELKVIHELLQKKVRIIITRFPPQNSQSMLIGRYIMENYTQIHSIYEFTIWKYKK